MFFFVFEFIYDKRNIITKSFSRPRKASIVMKLVWFVYFDGLNMNAKIIPKVPPCQPFFTTKYASAGDPENHQLSRPFPPGNCRYEPCEGFSDKPPTLTLVQSREPTNECKCPLNTQP